MGFRELEKFNDAMLTKQIWRLLHNTDSLFYKVSKAKFFPNGLTLEAKENTHGSYAWKCIVKARKVIELGKVWRIGDGRTAKIEGDKWLPDPYCRQVLSPVSELSLGAKVCS